ncbi:NUDIX domain-containing protein [Gluconacetobacter sp. 1c LMG 22058]|uniref:NUDIX domain-containing protein n=1 Tax=Gluconacetobacter dulcium TaxID=2729096 RepID=A0A7W4K3U2_9PROT|nr:NUDIX domain-containing protein [Gluconacetobacter dulcium]MBB2199872.1 NUDIX domain-containing protein [Gluconacetobacter dulcium]
MTASLIILHPLELKLLCVLHPKFACWMFPGGHIEPAESPDQAALREVAEEVGLVVRLCDMSALPVWDDGSNRRLPQPLAIIQEVVHNSDVNVKFIDFVFVGIAEGNHCTLNAEVKKAAWCDISEIAELNTAYPIYALAVKVFDDIAVIRSRMGI